MATPEELANAAKLAENQEALNREVEKYKEGLAEAARLQVDLNKATAEKLRLDLEAKEANKQATDALKEQVRIESEIKTLKQQMTTANAEDLDTYQQLIDIEKNNLAMQVAISNARSDELDLIKKKKKLIEDTAAAEKKYGKQVEDNLKNAKKASQTYSAIFKEFAGDLPVIGPSISKLLDQQANMAKMGDKLISKTAGQTGATAELTRKMGKFLKGIGMTTVAAIAFVGILAKMALQFDDLSKSIGRATGFGNEFANTLTEGYKQTMSSGVEMKEYADSVTSLGHSFSGFNPSAEKTNIHLANTASQLTKLGVSADSSAKLMDHFHRAMGVSQEMAADMTAQLVLMGKNAGITAAKMASDFQASAGRLAIYGKNNIKVFKQLAAQAKATGLEMSTLLGISQKFDTFDSAADSVGQLNAVLGTQLSTLEMMNATDAERVKIMKEQVQASVGNFDSLDKFTKMYVAQAMGVKDVAEAQRLLNMSQAQASKYAQEQKESADIQAELAERTKELVPLMQKLKIAGYKLLMAFSPIIKVFGMLITLLAAIIDFISPIVAALGPVILFLVAFGKVMATVGAGAAAVATPVGWVVLGLVALVAVLGQIFDLFGMKINPVFVNIFAHLAETLMTMVSPLGMVVKGMGMLGSAFTYVFGEAKKEKADLAGGFDIQALAEIDTSKVAAGINEIKSAVMELAGIKMDGFLAMSTTGDSSSFVMGSDGLIKSISEGKLIVDVKMPEMKLPEVLVKVFIGDRELKSIIRTEVKALGGAMG